MRYLQIGNCGKTNDVASEDPQVSFLAAKLMSSRKSMFRAYATPDVMGCEVAGAVKNVLAIASGAAHALGLGNNARAGMLCRGLAEMKRLALALGSTGACLNGLAGTGDLFLTCSSELSRNFSVGVRVASGAKIDAEGGGGSASSTGGTGVAEGVLTAKSIHQLCELKGVFMPICNEVYHVLYENKPFPEALRSLMERPLSIE